MATKRRKTRKATKARRAPRKVARRKAPARKVRSIVRAARKAPARKATRRRKPMSAAARKAFRERMDAARARKMGGRFRRSPDLTGMGASEARDRLSEEERQPRLRKRMSIPSNAAARIVAILRRSGFEARFVRRPDCLEIVTDAPESACIEAARAAGA